MFLVIYYFSRVIGISLIIISLILAFYFMRMKRQGLEIKVQIISIKERVVRTGKQVYTLYIPIFNYLLGDKIYSGEGPSAQDEKTHQIGETIVIRVNPRKPEKYIIPGKNNDLLNFIYIFGAGILLFILSFFLK